MPNRLDVLYEVVAHLGKLCNTRVGTFQKRYMIRKIRSLYIDHYSIGTLIDDSSENCSGLLSIVPSPCATD